MLVQWFLDRSCKVLDLAKHTVVAAEMPMLWSHAPIMQLHCQLHQAYLKMMHRDVRRFVAVSRVRWCQRLVHLALWGLRSFRSRGGSMSHSTPEAEHKYSLVAPIPNKAPPRPETLKSPCVSSSVDALHHRCSEQPTAAHKKWCWRRAQPPLAWSHAMSCSCLNARTTTSFSEANAV